MALCDRIAYGSGVFFIICGIVIGFAWPLIFNYISKEKLVLRNSSETYKLWVKTPIPMYLDVYLFNWTNSEQFLKNTKITPEFEEIGPFVFKEVHERVAVTWNGNNTVSYNQTRIWSFVPEESVDLSVPIHNLNVIATAVTKMASGQSFLVKLVTDFLIYGYKEKLIIARPAKEWLFEGMSDKLLDLIRKFVNVPYDKFGWFYGRNLSSTFDGRFTINTGEGNIFSLGAMEEWNYVNKTRFYKGECGVVKGSSGELFSPVRDHQDNLSIFVTDFCGALTLKYSGQRSVEGLDGYYYVGDKSVFDNGTSDPSSKCFCTGDCIASGVRNVTSCRQAPLFLSFPHFYLADPTYTKSIKGMSPNKTEHEFFLSIDPMTGIPLEVRAQLQLNVLLQPLKGFPMFAEVPRVFVPMMWFRQRAKVTPYLASRGKTLKMFESVGLWVACALSLLGLCIIILRLCFVKFCSKSKPFELLITPTETEEEEVAEVKNSRISNSSSSESGVKVSGVRGTEESGRHHDFDSVDILLH